MLKLSTYGFIKYSIFLFPEASYYFTPLVHVLCVIGIIYSSFTTLRQIDIKKIIAYSSIGQNGPLNDILVYHPTQQTICGKFKISLISMLKNTKIISSLILFLDSILVRNFLIYLNNPQITYTLSTLMGISEAICLLFTYIFKNFKRISIFSIYFGKKFYTTSTKKKDKAKKQFNEWLAGLIDGDGYLYLTKKGLTGLEITMDLRDEHCLYLIKKQFGGSIKLKSGAKAVKYRLHHKEGMLTLISAINGLIRNPIRFNQLGKICEKYNINLIKPSSLNYNNGWLAGFFDSDGSIFINNINHTIVFLFTQKHNNLFEELKNLYGGKIYFHDKKYKTFRWVIYRKEEVLSLYKNYFHFYPSKSAKMVRINLIPKYYELKELKCHLIDDNSILNKAWKQLINSWNKNFK